MLVLQVKRYIEYRNELIMCLITQLNIEYPNEIDW